METKAQLRGMVAVRILASTVLAAMLATPVLAKSPTPKPTPGQASITLTNCDADYCYTHDNTWTIAKEVKSTSVTDGVGTVTWTVTATKDDSAGPTFTVHGGLTIQNTGSANATIGNIVVNLQKPNYPKKGSKASYVSIAADVADATNGDAATSANIVAAGSQENVATNLAWGTNNYAVSGAKGTFTETSCSGGLEFTDETGNTVFSLTPQLVISPGDAITLLYTAEFDVDCLPAPGTAMRAEALVTFGNAGARGGSGASAQNIDIDGDSCVDNSSTTCPPANDDDEANVRTVPCRDTLAALPATPTETNDSVTVTDPYSDSVETNGTVTVSNPVGFDQFPATVNETTSWDVSVDVDSGEAGGEVCNSAALDGSEGSCTLTVIVSYEEDGITPIYAPCVCAAPAHDEASACEDISPPSGGGGECTPGEPGCFTEDYCTYTQGKYNANANNDVATYLTNHFAMLVFPAPGALGVLRIGIEAADPKHDAQWENVSNFRTWIGGGGPSGALTADTDNATSTSGGTLGKQTGAMTVNLALSGVMPGDPAGLGGLTLCNLVEGSVIGSWTLTAAQAAALNGTSISQVLADANNALGGNGLPAYAGTFGNLNELVSQLNSGAFDDCGKGPLAASYLCEE